MVSGIIKALTLAGSFDARDRKLVEELSTHLAAEQATEMRLERLFDGWRNKYLKLAAEVNYGPALPPTAPIF
jgi:hypothetical protein